MKLLSKFESRGNIELLSKNTVALFASKKTPLEIYNEAEKIFTKLKEKPISIASGWQAPLERRLLNLANRKMQASIIYYTAKDLSQVNMNSNLQELENENKLLLISPQSRKKRAAKNDINKRDNLLFSQINQVLFLYIAPNGRLEKYYNQLQEKNHPVFVLQHSLNKRFQQTGYPALSEYNLEDFF